MTRPSGMRLLTLTFALASSAPCQPPDLVAEIERMAASEPLVYSVDTRLRLATLLDSKQREKAARLVSETVTRYHSVRDPEAQGVLGVALAEALVVDDPEEAERIAHTIPSRATSGTLEDYRSAAFDKLVRYWAQRDPARALRLLNEGAASGAVLMESAERILKRLIEEDPSQAQSLFARMVAAFDDSAERQVFFLLRCAREMSRVDYPLAAAALDKILAMIDRGDFNSSSEYEVLLDVRVAGRRLATRSTRETLIWQVGAFLASQMPALYDQHKDRFRRWKDAIEEAAAGVKVEQSQGVRFKDDRKQRAHFGEDFSDLPFDEAMEEARKLDEPEAQVASLLQLYRREKASASQRSQAILEALNRVSSMPIAQPRIDAIETLLDIFDERKDAARFRRTAELLAATTAAYCRCESHDCEKRAIACLDLYETLQDAFDDHGLDPKMLDLEDPSLRVRVLLTRLGKLTR
ncbi:MAG: hypothetical protein ACRD8O_15795 [Bryobacteraceae bacterium]